MPGRPSEGSGFEIVAKCLEDLDSAHDFDPYKQSLTLPARRRRVDVVAAFLWKIGGGSDESCAALLHDYLHLGKSRSGIKEYFHSIDESDNNDSESLVRKLGKAFTESNTDTEKRTFLQFVSEKSLVARFCIHVLTRG